MGVNKLDIIKKAVSFIGIKFPTKDTALY